METKPGRGRPTKYNTRLLERVTNYTVKCLNQGIFPTIEELAAVLGIGTRTIYDWELEHAEFSQTIDTLRDTQKHLLITNGLNGNYNTRFSMFLLRSIHGLTEKEPLINATQNSYMNISPDVLADALKLMGNTDGN